ncbi:MAG: carboxypeptidase-like regulatory domain-containing protein, partial [Bryobacteraceae bacterium]
MKIAAAWLALACAGSVVAQSLTGELRGAIVDSYGRPLPGAVVSIAGAPAAFQVKVRADRAAEFRVAVPYGLYRIGRTHIYVPPLGVVCVRASADLAAVEQLPCGSQPARPQQPDRSDTYGADALLNLLHPASVSAPLGLAGNRSRPDSLVSQNGFSWTDVERSFQGSDIGDPYQPGRALFAPDLASIEELMVRDGLEIGDSRAFGSPLAEFAAAFATGWHGAFATTGTGGFLASNNLPAPAA